MQDTVVQDIQKKYIIMVITPTVTLLLRGENNSKQLDEFQASNYWQLINWLIDLQSLQSFVNKHLSKLSLEVDNIDSQVLMNYRAVIKGHEMGILPQLPQWMWPLATFVGK